MLKDLTDTSLIRLNIEADDWQTAIRKAAQPTCGSQKSKSSLCKMKSSMVYWRWDLILSLPNMWQLPHGKTRRLGARRKCRLVLLQFEHPVKFGNKDNDPVKYLFCLSATDNIKHLNALAELAGLFEEKAFFDLLDQANTPEEIMEYLNK